MEFRQFLSLLDGVRGTDSQYTARCPAHDDKRASLCVSQGSDGRILLKCQAGCDWREVIDALGVKKAEKLVDDFLSLNSLGQQKAAERVEELTEIPKYRRDPSLPEHKPKNHTKDK